MADKEALIQELLEIAQELGWSVAIPSTDDDEEVPGLIIGEPGYVDMVTQAVDEMAAFNLPSEDGEEE